MGRPHEKPPPRSRGGGHENEQPAKPLDHNLTDNDNAHATTERLSFRLVVEVGLVAREDAVSADGLSRQIERLGRVLSSRRDRLPRERMAHLARSIHTLGERPLCELFLELAGGRPLNESLEDYARLVAVADLIAAFDGGLPTMRPVR